MRKKILLLVISVIYLILIAIGLTLVFSAGTPGPAAQLTAADADGKISIAHTELFGKLQRPHVIFDHKLHEKALENEGCAACHPVNDMNKIIFTFPKRIDGQGYKAAMNAFHDACIGCHKKMKAGPLTCNNCHKKELADVKISYPAAEFDAADHNTHVRVMRDRFGRGDCGQCHHTYDTKEQKLVRKAGTEDPCAYCHDLNKKRGPELAAVTSVAAGKGLSTRKVSHQQCLGCHLELRDEYQKMSNKDTAHNLHKDKVRCGACHLPNTKSVVSCTSCHIPTDCSKCHTGEYRTADDLRNVPRPYRGQKDVAYITIENARMHGVAFNHRAHQSYAKSCSSCHHERLKACKDCHSLTGKPEGNNVSIAKAYHSAFSPYSCSGCHNQMKAQKECAGCHYNIADVDVETMNPKKETCARCHSGRRDAEGMPQAFAVPGVVGNISINVLEKEYDSAVFPHADILRALTRISNESRLATYFHRDVQTLCAGCHHYSAGAAEAQRGLPPNCRNCHMIDYDEKNLNDVRLLSAYHNQCLGCHDRMGIAKGGGATDKEGDRCAACHQRKAGGPADITSLKNATVVKQNTARNLNAWRPYSKSVLENE